MDCSEVKAQLVEAAFGLADDPAVTAHVEMCAFCGPALAGLADRRRALRSYGARTPSPELHDRILRKVRAGSRRRLLLAVAAGLLLGVPGALAGWRPGVADRVDGDFDVRQGDTWAPASGGRPAVAGLEIRTREGCARMTLGGRSEIDLHPGTQMAVRSIDPSGLIVLAQERGEAHYRVRPHSGGFEVRTPAAAIHVQGTEFQILMKGEDPMKKGTVLGTALAAVVGVSSGMVAVRNTHGEVRVAPSSIATSTASAAPRLLADSESRVRALEAEHAAIARRVHKDFTQLEELGRRGKELDSAAASPKKASTAGSLMKAIMSVEQRRDVKGKARETRDTLALTDEQTARLEMLFAKVHDDYYGVALAHAITPEDLERTVASVEAQEKTFLELLTEEQKKKVAGKPMPPTSLLGGGSWGSEADALLQDLDPESRAAAKRELTRFIVAARILMIRAQVFETGPEAARLRDELAPRYETRLKEIIAPDRAAALLALTRKFTTINGK